MSQATAPAPAASAPGDKAPAGARALTGTQVGVVTSASRDKTRTVVVDFQVRHPKYGKYLKRRTKYHVHDEKNTSKLGDRVEIANCRPVSRTKSWRLVRVIASVAAPLEHRTEAEAAPTPGAGA